MGSELDRLDHEATDPSILANAPGELSVEVQLDQASPDALDRLQKCIGFNGQEGNVLLTVVNGSQDVSLELKPDDIAVLKDALDLCQDWARAEQSSEETAGQ